MLYFPPVLLPPDYSRLLKSYPGETKETPFWLHRFVHTDSEPFLKPLVERTFPRNGPKSTEISYLNIFGWRNFRNHLGSLYLFHAQHSSYPRTTKVQLIDEVNLGETRLLPFSLIPGSRAYLLYFYLELCKQDQKGFVMHESERPSIPEELFSVLTLLKARSELIDWLVLLLWHLGHFWGFDQLTTKIKETQMEYQLLYHQLNHHQRKLLVSNLPNYGYSIQEDALFMTP